MVNSSQGGGSKDTWVLSPPRQASEPEGTGKVYAVVGAKGGVGATTVVTHMALDVARTVASLTVCLVDLDLEKGDVPGHVEVRHRLGISDLAKVADDLLNKIAEIDKIFWETKQA